MVKIRTQEFKDGCEGVWGRFFEKMTESSVSGLSVAMVKWDEAVYWGGAWFTSIGEMTNDECRMTNQKCEI
jgi:hypothetical protein